MSAKTNVPQPVVASSTPGTSKKPKVTPITPPIASALHELNEEIIYIRATKEIVELIPQPGETKLTYTSVYNFKIADYSNRCIEINGTPIYLADLWMKFPKRNEARKTVYEPDRPRITAEGNLNAWFPSNCKPKKGDLTLFFQYLDFLFKSDPTFRDWLMIWLAYPLQRPGTKLKTGIFCWSSMTGNGKSTLGTIMREIYGDHNSYLIKENEIFARFNEWQQNKQFIFVDELKRDGSGKKSDAIKPLITQTRVSIETKYQRPYELVDCMNYYVTSNHIEALHLDPEDRRFFVHNVGKTKAPKSFFSRFYRWLDHEDGYAAIYYHLLNDIDITAPVVGGDPYTLIPTQFDPNADAPHTQARTKLIQASFDDADLWIQDLIDSPQNILGDHHHCKLFRCKDLYDKFRISQPEFKINKAWFGRKLSQKLIKLNNDNAVTLHDGCRDRLYSAVQECEDWDAAQLRAVYEQERL